MYYLCLMESLETTFFYNLEKTVKTYRQFFQSQLKEKGYSITLDQWLTLKMMIDFPDASQMDIAQKVFKDKASVTRIINLLIGNEYLTRKQHPDHQKRSLYELTLKGRNTLEELNVLVPEIRENALTGMNINDINFVLENLLKITENCNKLVTI